MKDRKRESLLSRIISKVLFWAAGKILESLPVIGPIFKVVSLVADIAALERTEPAYVTA